MADEKKKEENEDLTDSPSDIERLKPERSTIDPAAPGEQSADGENMLKDDTLEGDPEIENSETIGIP